AHAAHAGDGKADGAAIRARLRREQAHRRRGLQREARLGASRRADAGLEELSHPHDRLLQRGGRQREKVDQRLRRSAAGPYRRGRLDRAHPLLGDTQLRAARAREPARLPSSLGRAERRLERGRPAPDRAGALSSTLPTFAACPAVALRSKAERMNEGYAELFVSATDGLRLFARDYGPQGSAALPVVCLPGLARTSADFHNLALALSRD